MPRYSAKTVKFMQVLSRKYYDDLQFLARQRGCSLQDLIRVAIIPEWYRDYMDSLKTKAKKKKAVS